MPARAPRVLHVSHSAQPGGSNEVLKATLRGQPADAASRCVFLQDGPERDRVRELGVPADVVEAGRAQELWRVPGVVARLAGAVRRHRAELVVAHVSKAQVYAGPAARLCGVPSVWWQHEHLGLARPLQAAAGRVPAAAVLCPSAWVAREQEQRFPRTPAQVVHPGVDPARFPAARTHEPTDAPVLAVLGRLQRWKRVELVLQALPTVLERVPGARLAVLGGATAGLEEDYPDELRALAARLGVADAVDFAGFVDDVPARLAQVDVLVHAAQREPFGLAVVEGMLAGLAVVGADEGGPAEVLRDGVDGVLADVTRPRELGATVASLLADHERRARLGAAARASALERFTDRRTAQRSWDLFSGAARRG
ncbi:glycosyltransferase family 4 protein [Conexibacter sp. SYSU D00693]|uniref:glycosyltransferase family 4 protein n=1 Tax=Conexibacter sp. SYSU D00693 TaxID=2812560 RepID=UPI00196A91B8|nr:glycosyltransferase family 4 protein [Conexibacter sp. SYSU D00693]